MRKIRTAICVIFAVTCVLFSFYVIKTRQLEDHTPPVITCAEDVLYVSVNAEEEELLAGVTAEDDKDGDITSSIRVSAMSHFIVEGRRTITYIVFDEANQAGSAERTVVYTDYVSPRIYLSEPLRYTINDFYDANMAENMTAEDCLDGDITNQIRITRNGSYYYEAGDYDVTAQVTNSAGDVCVLTLKATVVDSGNEKELEKYYPVLSEYIVYTEMGSELNFSQYLVGVKRGSKEYTFADDTELLSFSKKDIDIEANVEYSKAGVYPVEYSYITSEGVQAVTRMYVVVEE